MSIDQPGRADTRGAAITRRGVIAGATAGISLAAVGGADTAFAAAKGQLTYAVHISLAPTWFDPAETSGLITPYVVLYAMHDALAKPMPGNLLAPSPGRFHPTPRSTSSSSARVPNSTTASRSPPTT